MPQIPLCIAQFWKIAWDGGHELFPRFKYRLLTACLRAHGLMLRLLFESLISDALKFMQSDWELDKLFHIISELDLLWILWLTGSFGKTNYHYSRRLQTWRPSHLIAFVGCYIILPDVISSTAEGDGGVDRHSDSSSLALPNFGVSVGTMFVPIGHLQTNNAIL